MFDAGPNSAIAAARSLIVGVTPAFAKQPVSELRGCHRSGIGSVESQGLREVVIEESLLVVFQHLLPSRLVDDHAL
jgi:hypothetical protein